MDLPWVLKASGVYEAPYGIMVSGSRPELRGIARINHGTGGEQHRGAHPGQSIISRSNRGVRLARRHLRWRI